MRPGQESLSPSQRRQGASSQVSYVPEESVVRTRKMQSGESPFEVTVEPSGRVREESTGEAKRMLT